MKHHDRLFKEVGNLVVLVENYDVIGIMNAIRGVDPEYGTLSVSHCPETTHYNTREYLTINKSAVERACELGYLDILNLFLLNGCSPNLPTSHGRLIHTVLTQLKSSRHLVDSGRAMVTIKLMIAKHCDLNVKDYGHKSTLMLACELADPAILKMVLRNCSDWQLSFRMKGSGSTALHMACMHGSVQCVRLLLKRLNKRQVNTLDKRFTPLMSTLIVLKHNIVFHGESRDIEAAVLQRQHSLLAIVELLLHAGADPNATASPDPDCLNLDSHSELSAIICALDVCDKYEEKVKALKSGPEELTVSRTLSSSYSRLIRLLVYWGAQPFQNQDLEELKSRFPCVKNLLMELAQYLNTKEIHLNETLKFCLHPCSLLEQARKSVRLHVARCNKLDQLEELPIPKQLKDFVMFYSL